jgi:hypothetical protein
MGQRTEFRRFEVGVPLRHASVAVLLAMALGLGACRTGTDDIQRWGTTVQGPRKLIAVLTHDKYSDEIRLEAALTLVSMKPRNGRRVGIEGSDDQPGLMGALSQLPPSARAGLVSKLVPALEAEIKKPPPVVQGGQAAADPTVPYKDAAFALLTHDGGRLVSDSNLRQRLRTALSSWVSTNFAQRLEDSSQMFSVKQVVTELKADAVRTLPNLITPGAPKIEALSDFVADFGDPATKLAASQRLVAVAAHTSSQEWINQKSPGVEAANKASKLNPTKEQFQAQLAQYQEEELLRVFASMKRVGGAPVTEFLLKFAQDKTQSDKRRAGALAALQGNLDRTNRAQANSVLAVAGAEDTPDMVRDVALQRVGEFPRAVVVEDLYKLFGSGNWKVRWVAAELILKMSDTSHLPEFFDKIGKAKDMAITEPLRYGSIISEMKGSTKPEDAVRSQLGSSEPVPARLTALGYYYAKGTGKDLGTISNYASDRSKTPTCKEGAQDCEWKCNVSADGKQETKDITTLGEFVEFCVKPAMEKRGAK